jgi:hypothetical protein
MTLHQTDNLSKTSWERNPVAQTPGTPKPTRVDNPMDTMVRLIMSKLITQAIYVAAELKIADRLKQGPKHFSKLAEEAEANNETLYRMLRALASIGIFAEDQKGYFANTTQSECLLSDNPNSLYNLAMMMGMESHWKAFGEFNHSIKTGKPSFDKANGKSLYSHLAQYREDNAIFNSAITGFSARSTDVIAKNYDFSRFKRIIDVAGGQGGLLATILKDNPGLKGTLFELPAVVAGARQYLNEQGMSNRCEVVAGDFFNVIPGDHDAYLLEYILHNWADAASISILTNIRNAMPANAKLLVIETIIPPGNEPHFGKWLDLEVMAITRGGKERTEVEFNALFEAAGLTLTRVITTPASLRIIEGIRK